MATARVLPQFKYHPDPIATNVIVERQTECPVCHQVTGFAYDGPFYTRANPTDICPWCIANGRAAESFDLEFVYDYDLEPVDDTSKTDELQHRTPGYFFATQYEWPTHCGDYCAVLRQVQWADIAHIEAELGDDLDRLEVEDGTDRQAKTRRPVGYCIVGIFISMSALWQTPNGRQLRVVRRQTPGGNG